MSDLALRLSGIVKAYNQGASSEVRVLNGVDLALFAGEMVALVAPSGAGKSTLLHIAGLLDTPDAGDVMIGRDDLTGASEAKRTRARRQNIGFVYQFHHLLPEFSALENIALPQYANGISPAAANMRGRQLLESVGLAHRADHRPAEMSGGEQQRAAFCRALANRPQILLADEPTGNLDPATSDQVFDRLIALTRHEGMAALVATHNMALAERMDRIVALENGVLTERMRVTAT